jgi:hypothetical protein
VPKFGNPTKRQTQANDAIESAYYRGDGVVGTGVDTEEHGSDQRYNLTQTDIDGQSLPNWHPDANVSTNLCYRPLKCP